MRFLKFILSLLINIIVCVSGIVVSAGTLWYVLPAIQTTVIGQGVLSVFSPTAIMWTTIGCAIAFVLFGLIQKFAFRRGSAKFKNFFIHLTTWLMALVIVGLSIATFIMVNPLVANEVVISVPRKISIGVTLVALVLFHIFSTKLSKIINRRIQAYENAKELNVVGRGSVIFTNLLKLLEVAFPEIVILLLLCFCVSWNVASYFIIILVASVIPMLGNIECDFNTRKEIQFRNKMENDKFAQQVADKMKGDR